MNTWNANADALRDSHSAAIDRIRQNTDLRPEAALKAMAKVHIEAKDQMDAMSGNAAGTKAADIAGAKRSLYGISDITKSMTPSEQVAAQMSFRDASQRASSITDVSEAQQLLDSANQTGDEMLARAIGNHALSMGMLTVADSYLGDRPDKVAAYQTLRTLTAAPTAASLFGFMLPKPSELVHLSDSKIAQIANS